MKRGIALTLIIISLSMACLFEVSSVKAESTTSDFSWRNWVNVEVVYLGSNSITLQLKFELIGNTLHNNTDIVITSIKSDVYWIVTTGGVPMRAWYSSDTNMTTYVYTLSSQLVDIKQSGNFPDDSWQITAQVLNQVPVLFDDTTEISSTPSQNYFCQYHVSDSFNASYDHNLFISIQHPSSFSGFVYLTYFLPIGLLLALLVCLIIILCIKRNRFGDVKNDLLIVSIGSVVFIPVYQLPLSSLKIPFLLTPFDYLFLGLLAAYFVFIIAVLTIKQTQKLKSEEDANNLNMAKTEKPKDFDHDSLIGDLVHKIDNEKSLFTWRDQLHGYGMTLYIVSIFLFLAFVVSYLPDSIAPFVGRMTIIIAILAVILTFVSCTSKDTENNVLEANFRKAIKKFKIGAEEEEKRLLLKALLKIKVMTPNSKLETVKKMHNGMFTKEMLLERLYEQQK